MGSSDSSHHLSSSGAVRTVAANDRPTLKRLFVLLTTPTVILGGGLLASGSNTLLFHALVELFTIVVALTSLAVASMSRRFTHNHFAVFIAVAIGWGANLDVMHMLSFRESGIFHAEDADLSMQFWIAARLMLAAALLCSPLFLRRSVPVNYLHMVFALLAAILVLWIMSGSFPRTYVEGLGPTAFKVNAEYLIIAILLLTAVLLWRQRRLMAPRLFFALQAILLLLALSDFSYGFVDHVSGGGWANEAAHVFKGYAYWFVYLAVVQSTLREPFSMLSRTAGTYDAIPAPVCLVAASGAILQANRASGRHAGVSPEELVGRSVHDIFHEASRKQGDCPVCAAMARGATSFVAETQDGSGRVLECSVAPFAVPGRRQRYVHVVHDITERKRLGDECGTLVHSLGERVKELRCLYAISELLDESGPEVSRLLPEVVRLLPSGFLHSQYAHAALQGEAGFVGDPGFEGARYGLTRDVIVSGRRFGALHVFYDKELPPAAPGIAPFLPEERELLRTVAQRVGEAIERREATEKVERLTYLYEMLSATNRAVARCSSKSELLQRVFDALIQHGTFPMLFIATTTDDTMPLRIVHCHGMDLAKQQEINALLADANSPLGQLPDELRKGQVVCRNLSQSPSHGTGPGYVGGEGGEGGAFLPLLCNGRVFGVIGLDGQGAGIGDVEQLRLLNEMTADLRFALDGLTAIERSEAAEQRASMSESRFRDVFEFSPGPKLIQSVSSRKVKAVNRAFLQWMGYDVSDIPTEDAWLDKMHVGLEAGERIKARWHEAVEKARTSAVAIQSPELHLRAKNGEERIAQGTMTLAGDDAIVAWTDLTEIRRAEEALRASESHFRNMIEQTLTSIYVRRGERFVYVNPSYSHLLGWSREELLGGCFWDFTASDPENVRRVHEAWDKLAHGETSVRAELRMICKNGESRELGLHATTIQWDNEPAAIVMAADITERKQAEQKIADYVRQLEASMRGTLQAVANMIDLRDPYTAGHERRVGLIAGAIAREMGWVEERCKSLELIGLVHDIGKIAVPAEILSKPGRLSPVEMDLVRGHVQAGYDILKDIPFSFPVAEIIYQHHERLDGSGYPRRLQGEQIMPEARILCVADVLESISAHRPYRPALGVEAALHELESGYGVLYDTVVIDAVRSLIHDKGYALPR